MDMSQSIHWYTQKQYQQPSAISYLNTNYENGQFQSQHQTEMKQQSVRFGKNEDQSRVSNDRDLSPFNWAENYQETSIGQLSSQLLNQSDQILNQNIKNQLAQGKDHIHEEAKDNAKVKQKKRNTTLQRLFSKVTKILKKNKIIKKGQYREIKQQTLYLLIKQNQILINDQLKNMMSIKQDQIKLYESIKNFSGQNIKFKKLFKQKN